MKRIIAGLLVAVFVAGVGLVLRAHGGDSTKIHACVDIFGGIRLVPPTTESCGLFRFPVDWNIQGPEGPQGHQGEPGPSGAAASTESLSRVAYARSQTAFKGHVTGDKELGVLNLTVCGEPGEVGFVKVDASVQVSTSHGDQDAIVWLALDGSEQTSMGQRFRVSHWGTPAALTWAVEVPSQTPAVFRVKMSHTLTDPNCVNFGSCPSYGTEVALSAICAPFGAHGMKSLN